MFINENGQKRPQSSTENRERNPSRASGLSDESIEFILLPPPAQGIPGDGEIVTAKNSNSGNSGYSSIGSYGSNHHGSHSKSNHFNFKPPTPPSPPMQAPPPPSGPKIARAYNRRSGPIQKKKDTARMVMPAPAPLSPVEYEVDKIMDTRRHRGIKQYRVKWKSFGDDMNTWEPEANLADCKELLLAYRRAQQQENGTRTRTRRITQPQHAMKTLDIQKCDGPKAIPSLTPTAANNSLTSIAETIAKLTKSNTFNPASPEQPQSPNTPPPKPVSPQIELENETQEDEDDDLHRPKTPEMDDFEPPSPVKSKLPEWAIYKPPNFPEKLTPEILKNEVSMKLLVISGKLVDCLLGVSHLGEDIIEHAKVRIYLEPPPPKITKSDMAKENIKNGENDEEDSSNPYSQSIISNSSFEISEQVLRITGHHEQIGQAVYLLAKKVMSSDFFQQQLIPGQPSNRINLQIILPDITCNSIFGARGERIHEMEAESSVKLSTSKEWVGNFVNHKQ